MGIEEEETIEQAAAARRERLKALKAAQQLLENPEDDETQANEDQNGDDENTHCLVDKIVDRQETVCMFPASCLYCLSHMKHDSLRYGNGIAVHGSLIYCYFLEDCSQLVTKVVAKLSPIYKLSVLCTQYIGAANQWPLVRRSNGFCDVNVKFRNYLPHDKQLQEGKLAPPELPKFEDPVAAEPPVEEKKEDPFLNIAPKKPNWDLRRDVQKKLDKLEKRTQKALYQLMEQQEKEKQLAEENGEDDDSGN
ncbi:coiled-coil domain-containing protein 12 [Tanacetum coccineum]